MAITFSLLPENACATYDEAMTAHQMSDEQGTQAQLHGKLRPLLRRANSSRTDRHATQLKALRRLYPRLSDNELMRARDNLKRYLVLSLRIFDRIQAEKGSSFLTAIGEESTMQSQRSNPS
jgi:hypothetical protein